MASPSVENQELYDANPAASERKNEGTGAGSDANRRKRKRPCSKSSTMPAGVRLISSSEINFAAVGLAAAAFADSRLAATA